MNSAPLTPTPRTPEIKKHAQVSPVWPPPSNVKYSKVTSLPEFFVYSFFFFNKLKKKMIIISDTLHSAQVCVSSLNVRNNPSMFVNFYIFMKIMYFHPFWSFKRLRRKLIFSRAPINVSYHTENDQKNNKSLEQIYTLKNMRMIVLPQSMKRRMLYFRSKKFAKNV